MITGAQQQQENTPTTAAWASLLSRLCFQHLLVCPFALLPYLTWPITCGNSTGLNDPTLPRLPPALLPFQKQSPVLRRQSFACYFYVCARVHCCESLKLCELKLWEPTATQPSHRSRPRNYKESGRNVAGIWKRPEHRSQTMFTNPSRIVHEQTT